MDNKVHKRLRLLEGFRTITETAEMIGADYFKLYKAIDRGEVNAPSHVLEKRKYYRIEEIQKLQIQLKKLGDRK